MTAKGIIYIALSSLCFALMNIIITHYCMSFQRADLLIARGFLGCIFIYLCFRPSLKNIKGTLCSRTVLIRSILASIALLLLYFNLNQTNAATASFLQNISFLFVLIIEIPKRQVPIRFVVVAGGLIFLGLFEVYHPQQFSSVVLVLGILSALFSSGSIITLKKATLTISPAMIALSFLSVNLLLGFIIKFIEPQGSQSTFQEYTFLVIEAIFAIFGQLLFSYGAKMTTASLIIPCSFMTIFFTLIIEVMFYGVAYSTHSIVGMIFVISGIILLSTAMERHRTPPSHDVPAKRGA